MNCIILPSHHFSASTAYINDPAQLAHIKNILSAKVGDTLKIGALGGNLGRAIIDRITQDSVQLCEIELTMPPPPKLNLTVILALPRPKVLRRLIMDMTALGVDHIILLNSYRSQKSYWQSPLLSRLDEFVLEGLQQGVDTIAPTISLQKRFKPFVEDELPSLIKGQAIVAHPYSPLSFSQYLRKLGSETPTFDVQNYASKTEMSLDFPDVVCIGAEGGWIDYEIELLSAQGCQAVHIGPRILRTEAAVNVILGQWLLRP